jgi:hypothetical protein
MPKQSPALERLLAMVATAAPERKHGAWRPANSGKRPVEMHVAAINVNQLPRCVA